MRAQQRLRDGLQLTTCTYFIEKTLCDVTEQNSNVLYSHTHYMMADRWTCLHQMSNCIEAYNHAQVSYSVNTANVLRHKHVLDRRRLMSESRQIIEQPSTTSQKLNNPVKQSRCLTNRPPIYTHQVRPLHTAAESHPTLSRQRLLHG